MIKEINANELKNILESKSDQYFLLDVREPYEFYDFNIGGTLIPLKELPTRMNEIPLDKEIIAICKAGVRSQHAARIIHTTYSDVKVSNLRGGLIAWVEAFGIS